MINLEGDEKVEGAAPSDPTPQPASDAADAVDAAASVEAPESNPPAAPASADPEGACLPLPFFHLAYSPLHIVATHPHTVHLCVIPTLLPH